MTTRTRFTVPVPVVPPRRFFSDRLLAGETRVSTTTLTNSGLVITVTGASAVFKVEAFLRVNAGSSAPDIRAQLFTAAAQPSGMWWGSSISPQTSMGVAGVATSAIVIAWPWVAGSFVPAGCATTTTFMRFTGIVTLAAGDQLSVRFAQDNSSATPTNLLTGSFLTLEEI